MRYDGPNYGPAARDDKRTTRWRGHVPRVAAPEAPKLRIDATVRFSAWARKQFNLSDDSRGVVRQIDLVNRRVYVQRPLSANWWSYDFWEEI